MFEWERVPQWGCWPALLPVFRPFCLIWFDAADIVRSAFHQRVHQIICLSLPEKTSIHCSNPKKNIFILLYAFKLRMKWKADRLKELRFFVHDSSQLKLSPWSLSQLWSACLSYLCSGFQGTSSGWSYCRNNEGGIFCSLSFFSQHVMSENNRQVQGTYYSLLCMSSMRSGKSTSRFRSQKPLISYDTWGDTRCYGCVNFTS